MEDFLASVFLNEICAIERGIKHYFDLVKQIYFGLQSE